MKYQAVLFDMDGTVLDTLDDLLDSTNYSLSHFGLPQVSREHIRRNLGNGALYLIRNSVPQGCSPELQEEILAFYKPWYAAHCRIKTAPYEGILPLMEALRDRGLQLAIVSNKPDTAVQELSEACFPGLLELSVGESPAVRRKPAPDTVLKAAEQMGLNAADCVYVGDSEVDIQTARNAGMDCIAVTWGFRDEPQLLEAGAEVLARSPEELLALILQS
ncbi:MAG: HAD family hydrolase [Oscillospiraceae bacterium]|nr:HAD family hydrolase [Oscillospiraceae bacterium]